jgi:prevent-host-death family protein
MTELRTEPGERLRDVHRGRASFVITKAGKPIAKLVPIDDDRTIILPDGRILGEPPLSAFVPGRVRRKR